MQTRKQKNNLKVQCAKHSPGFELVAVAEKQRMDGEDIQDKRVEAGCGFSDQAVMMNCYGWKMH